jgi:septum formation protein
MTLPATPHLFLASRSPRRRDLLDQIGVVYEVLDLEVVEEVLPGEAAIDYVRRVARDKAGAGLLQVAGVPGAVVLGADTEVVLDGRIFGKPADAADARAMLQMLSGRCHDVHSAVALVGQASEFETVVTSRVRFAALSNGAIDAYIDSGECMGKAGAYAIQGRAARFIEYIEGSYTGIMGLPLFETGVLLRKFGL